VGIVIFQYHATTTWAGTLAKYTIVASERNDTEVRVVASEMSELLG